MAPFSPFPEAGQGLGFVFHGLFSRVDATLMSMWSSIIAGQHSSNPYLILVPHCWDPALWIMDSSMDRET